MCPASSHLQFSGPTDLMGLQHTPLTGSSIQVVPGLLLPSTGQCQFWQPLLEGRTEEETLGFAIVAFQLCFVDTHGINYRSMHLAIGGLEEAVFSPVELWRESRTSIETAPETMFQLKSLQ